MKSIRMLHPLRKPLGLLAVILAPVCAWAQPNPNPPGQISFQGFVTDANGVALALTQPKNYVVNFRIYPVATGSGALWGEVQTVVVDRGYFSVMLGQGSALTTGEVWTNNLAGLFTGATASDRYVGITVTGIANPDSEIQPRLRLLASPYSFLAGSANTLVGNTGQQLISGSSGSLTLNVTNAIFNGTPSFHGTPSFTGPASFTGTPTFSSGFSVAGTISGSPNFSGTPSFGSGLSVTGGSVNGNPSFSGTPSFAGGFNVSGNIGGTPTFTSASTFNSSVTVGGNLRAGSFTGPGTIPLGGIIMWSGSTAPTGWALCDGGTYSGQTTPDLRGRFVLSSGAGAGLSVRTVGQRGGEENHTLTTAEMPAHNHSISLSVNTVGYSASWNGSAEATGAPGQGRNNGTQTWYPSSGNTGSGVAHNTMPPYYVLAFIMRVQ